MTNEEKINALRGIVGKYELSDTELQVVESAISEIHKSDKYRWHDLRKNPEDLPEENPLNNHENDVILIVEYANGKYKPEVHTGHLKSKTPHSTKNEKGDDNFWGLPTYDTNWTIWGWSYFYEPIVVAWKEIEPFDEVNK